MDITAAMVKELRQRTGAGMMECKKALVQNDGDIETAIDWMRKEGVMKAEKKSGRVAAEGAVCLAVDENSAIGILLEINSETDFVANGEQFQTFAKAVAQLSLSEKVGDLEVLKNLLFDASSTVEQQRKELVAKVGENIALRRVVCVRSEHGPLGAYLHGRRIGVLVAMKGGDQELAKDMAMHIAASSPLCVSPEDVPEELVAREKEIFLSQAQSSGKPQNIIDKMVEGRLRKFLVEISLVGQSFVKDPDQSVGDVLKTAGAEVEQFVRFEVGEGIEKRESDFAAEVMAQVHVRQD